MTKQVQIRRGNTDACDNFIGAVGEICVDLGNAIDRSHTLRIHDNNKLGGWKLINENHLEDRLKLFVSELLSSDLYLKNASQTITGTVKINSADNQSALNIFYPYGNAEDIRFIAETSGKDSDGNPVVTRYPATAIRSSNSSGTNTTTIGNLIPNAYNNEETESPQFAFSGSLMIQTTSEGSKFFLSQNPSVDSNGFEIATTSWVRTNLENRIGTLFGLVDSLSGKVTNLNFLTEKTADDRYVKKTGGTIGGTMTGKLIFDFHGEKKTDRIVEGILTSEQTKEDGESFYKEFGVVTPKTDANGNTSNKYVGVLRIGKRYINADTERNYTRLYAYNTSGVNSKDEHNFNALGIEYDERTESVRSYAPTPKEDSNTHEIATTKWVNEIIKRFDGIDVKKINEAINKINSPTLFDTSLYEAITPDYANAIEIPVKGSGTVEYKVTCYGIYRHFGVFNTGNVYVNGVRIDHYTWAYNGWQGHGSCDIFVKPKDVIKIVNSSMWGKNMWYYIYPFKIQGGNK